MKPKRIAGLSIVVAIFAAAAGITEAAQGAKTYIYVLRPVSRLQVEANWTEADNAVVAEHLAYLKGLLADGRLILAGKTDGLDARTFGIVVFEADSMEAAERTMTEDPAVKAGIMAGECFPYSVALSRS
jgi:uncharacterized protein